MRCALLALLLCLVLCAPCAAESLRATLQFGGDVLIHEPLLEDAYDAATDSYDFTHMLEPIAHMLAETDLTVLNLEVPIAGGKYSGYPRFNSPPALLDALRGAGADLLLCANNHALDRLGRGARQTIEAIEAAGLAHIGTARDRHEYNAVPMFDLGGIQVAIFNYTQHTNGMEKEDSEENLRHAVHYFAVSRAQQDIAAAREAGADYVILCVHWGKEYEREPAGSTLRLAQALCEAGADLVVGGHPHVLQPYEMLAHTPKRGEARETLTLYSTGNFLSGQREQYRDSGALFRFTLEKDEASGATRLADYGYIPTWVWLDEATGRYRVLPHEDAAAQPPDGMAERDIRRMRDALAETVDLLGPDRLLSTGPATVDDTSAETPSPADAPEAWFGFIAPGD